MNIQKAIAIIHLSIGFLFHPFPGGRTGVFVFMGTLIMVPIYPVLKESGILFKLKEHQQKFRFGNSKGSVGTLSLGSGPQLTLSEKTLIRDYRK